MIELLLMADRLLDAGSLDRAARLYEQVVEADPRNAIALVGLARVAIARGEHASAAGLVQRAMAIDPEDAAGLELERWLDDVGALGGDPGPGIAVEMTTGVIMPPDESVASTDGAGLPPSAQPTTETVTHEAAGRRLWHRLRRLLGRG